MRSCRYIALFSMYTCAGFAHSESILCCSSLRCYIRRAIFLIIRAELSIIFV